MELAIDWNTTLETSETVLELVPGQHVELEPEEDGRWRVIVDGIECGTVSEETANLFFGC